MLGKFFLIKEEHLKKKRWNRKRRIK